MTVAGGGGFGWGGLGGGSWGGGGWTGGGLFGGPSFGAGLGGYGAGSVGGGSLGGWGTIIPTAMGRQPVGPVPQYFTATPTGFAPLSPLAQAYLSRMFPAGLWGEETKEYTKTPYQAAQPEVRATAEYPAIGELLKAAVPEVAEVKGLTEKVSPKPASAQLYRQLEAQGALPNLRQYVEDILQVPWETYVGTMQAFWPSATQERPVQWRMAKQR